MKAESTHFSGFLRIVLMMGLVFLAVSYTSITNAAQGCGYGFHRSMYGGCVLNHPGPYANPAARHPGCWRNAYGYLRCYR